MPSVESINSHWFDPESFSSLRPSEHGAYELRLLSSDPDLILPKSIPKDRLSTKAIWTNMN